MVGYFRNFQVTAQSKQSPIGRKFDLSGHPDSYIHMLFVPTDTCQSCNFSDPVTGSVARYFLVQHTKMGENIPKTTLVQHTKTGENIPKTT
jgi:hypothetical protein